ncbi:hypothetical protein [Spirosoma spitsbergense]|uniref:hypothetical protein n=1 Tax=Spirosoma spitsbergense TaxID=431554 RepID=UPI00037DB643|nr:hypothetical protein [Spirosoma spitsbergense]
MNNQQYQPNLLDVPISIFANRFAKEPEGVTTLRRIASREINRVTIEAIRDEADEVKQKNLKDNLRAFAPVALLHHRKADTPFSERIAEQWPLLMGDIDLKDNKGLNMAELKTHLCRLPYLLLCAYSVRGGLWFVIRLPDNQTPETLAAHFRYLQRVFTELFGVKLDSSKGGNPTDLRFVSFDTAPFFKEQATVMTGTYTPPKPKPASPRPLIRSHFQPAGEWELRQVVELARKAQKGDRHGPLLKAATLAGGFVSAGRLDYNTAVYALETIASELDNFRDSERAIKDGITYGEQKPLYPDTSYHETRYKPPPTPPQRSDTRQNNTWLFDGLMIHGEQLSYEPCDNYPPEWET